MLSLLRPSKSVPSIVRCVCWLCWSKSSPEKEQIAKTCSSRHSSHSSCNIFQLSITLCREPPQTVPWTVHLVGHNVLKPGNLGAKSSLNFLNNASRFGETFKVFDFLNHITNSQLQRIPVAMVENVSQLFCFDLSSPLYLWQERSFLCNGEDKKFRFQWLITCPQTRKKGD